MNAGWIFLLFPLIPVGGMVLTSLFFARRNDALRAVHTFDPRASASFVGGGRTNRFWGWNASWPLTRLTVDWEYICIAPSARFVPFPMILMSRADVVEIRRPALSTGIRIRLADGRQPWFSTFSNNRVREALAAFSWPVDGYNLPPSYGPVSYGPPSGYGSPTYGPPGSFGPPGHGPPPPYGYPPPRYPPPPPPPPP